MATNARRNPRTASAEQSIWSELSEDVFRTRLVELEERTNAVPISPTTFNIKDEFQSDAGGNHEGNNLLPLALEQQLTNDFAWIAAIEEGAQSVAACYLQYSCKLNAVRVRLAAVDVIDERLAASLRSVCDHLSEASDPLADHPAVLGRLYHLILRIHYRRILGRLRSCKWNKPLHLIRSHKKPLWQDFANLKHRVQFLYTRQQTTDRQEVETLIDSLREEYEQFEGKVSNSGDEIEATARLVVASLQFCRSSPIQVYLEKLENVRATAQVASAIKCIRQIEKIAAYRRICLTLTGAVRKYPSLFKCVELEFSIPYAQIPTPIGFENWARTCHVHAEVQLILDYDMMDADQNRGQFSKPRVIGTSKDLCYLCYLFMKHHGAFQPHSTHGRLYDQWTVPDLADFAEHCRMRYSNVLRSMNGEILEKLSDQCIKRVEPMTSRQDLRRIYEADSLTRVGA